MNTFASSSTISAYQAPKSSGLPADQEIPTGRALGFTSEPIGSKLRIGHPPSLQIVFVSRLLQTEQASFHPQRLVPPPSGASMSCQHLTGFKQWLSTRELYQYEIQGVSHGNHCRYLSSLPILSAMGRDCSLTPLVYIFIQCGQIPHRRRPAGAPPPFSERTSFGAFFFRPPSTVLPTLRASSSSFHATSMVQSLASSLGDDVGCRLREAAKCDDHQGVDRRANGST